MNRNPYYSFLTITTNPSNNIINANYLHILIPSKTSFYVQHKGWSAIDLKITVDFYPCSTKFSPFYAFSISIYE